MSFLSLAEISNAVDGRLLSQVERPVKGVGTDTRKDLTNLAFIALRGENFDAHNYLLDACKQGASLLIVDKEESITEELSSKASIIKVKDTLIALQKLASFWRTKNNFNVVAITGSNGKTTSKEFVAPMLAEKFKVSYAKGSFNNHWGVPITLLEAPADAEVVICEMGMNHRGELTKLCEIAKPNVVVCTTVGSSHVGELGSIAEVARAKEEIYLGSPDAIAIFNIANEHTLEMYKHALEHQKHPKIIKFSNFSMEKPDVTLRITHMEIESLRVTGEIDGVKGDAEVKVFGRQNVNNLMVAASICLACKMAPEEIWKALPKCKTTWGRNQLFKSPGGATVIFDGYNANLESMTALMKNLYELETEGKKYVILGEMFELGEYTQSYHHQLGALVGKCMFDFIWFVGVSGEFFKAGVDEAGWGHEVQLTEGCDIKMAEDLNSALKDGDIVVIKGSRGMKMEQLLSEMVPHESIS